MSTVAIDDDPSSDMRGSDEWRRHRVCTLTLRYRTWSYAAQDIEALAARFGIALRHVAHALDIDSASLPGVEIVVDGLPGASGEQPPSFGPSGRPAPLVRWVVHAPESPCLLPEVELLRVLLPCRFGPAPPVASFWDEGLAGHVAKGTGQSP